MGAFYVTENGYLVSAGYCMDGMEAGQARDGQVAALGHPPGFTGDGTPYPGARWHVGQRAWVDARSQTEREQAAKRAVIEARVSAYPPLSELADAMYWQAQGDNSKMDAYVAAVAAVKEQFPKAN